MHRPAVSGAALESDEVYTELIVDGFHLHPATVRLVVSDEQKFSMSANFTTKVYRKGTYPYIYLRGSDRNTDGTFVPGSKIPLRVFNATGVAEVRWFFDGSPVEAESDGYFTVRRSGTLCAEIYYEDGTEERIIKEIRTR